MKTSSSVWVWALPLAVGVAAYLWPVAASPASHGTGPKSAPRQPEPRRSDGQTVLAEAHDILAARRDQQEDLLAHLGREERRALFLEKRDKLDDINRRCQRVFLPCGLPSEYYAAQEIATAIITDEGLAGVQWVAEAWPGNVQFPLNDWAEKHPADAFAYLKEAQHLNPCTPEMTLHLVAVQATTNGGSGEDLLAAVKQVPWHLFQDTDGSALVFRLSEELDPVKWQTGGAAAYLRDQGVEVGGVMAPLANTAPDLAIQVWLAEPKDGTGQLPPLGEVFEEMRKWPEVEEKMVNAFQCSGPEAQRALHQELLREDYSAYSGAARDWFGRLREKLFPGEAWDTESPQDNSAADGHDR